MDKRKDKYLWRELNQLRYADVVIIESTLEEVQTMPTEVSKKFETKRLKGCKMNGQL